MSGETGFERDLVGNRTRPGGGRAGGHPGAAAECRRGASTRRAGVASRHSDGRARARAGAGSGGSRSRMAMTLDNYEVYVGPINAPVTSMMRWATHQGRDSLDLLAETN